MKIIIKDIVTHKTITSFDSNDFNVNESSIFTLVVTTNNEFKTITETTFKLKVVNSNLTTVQLIELDKQCESINNTLFIYAIILKENTEYK